jgi:hypothetical protein
VTLLSGYFWFIVFECGFVNEERGTFANLNQVVARFGISRVSYQISSLPIGVVDRLTQSSSRIDVPILARMLFLDVQRSAPTLMSSQVTP